jgi:hypothetical protein
MMCHKRAERRCQTKRLSAANSETVRRRIARAVRARETEPDTRPLHSLVTLLGYEIKPDVNDGLVRSQVTRDASQIQTIADEWRTAMLQEGGRDRPPAHTADPIVGSELPFAGTFEANETASGPGGAQHHLEGIGNATHLGRFTITSDFTVDPITVTGAGTATWTAANGDQIFTAETGQGVVTFPTLTVDETHTITGGTGRFEGASGTFVVERSINLPTLTSSATFTGTISLAH